jgi:hypothetical protein
LRRDAIEIATVLLKIFFVVCEVRLALLQERFRLPERQPKDASDLLAAKRTAPFSQRRARFSSDFAS